MRIECDDCGQFNGYAKQHSGFDKTLLKDFPAGQNAWARDLATAIQAHLYDLAEHNDMSGKKITIIAKVR